MRRLAAALSIVLSVACRQEQAETIVQSRCLTDGECEPEARCDLARQQCYREAPDHDYQVVLQVYAQHDDLPLVQQHTHVFTLSDSDKSLVIEVPESVLVESNVSSEARSAVEAEVTFKPTQQDGDLPGKSIVVNARMKEPTDMNVRALLNPTAQYEVSVQPLVQASMELPPLRLDDFKYGKSLDLTYGPMVEFSAKLCDERGDGPVACSGGHRVRLEDADKGQVLSSTMTVADDGTFQLYADPAVLAGRTFNLAISLRGYRTWQVKVLVDGSQLTGKPGSIVRMPIVPGQATLYGGVENGDEQSVAYADVAYVSDFKFTPSPNATGGIDWCRWRFAQNEKLALSCSTRGSTTADGNGRYSLSTPPGLYQIFATPPSATARDPLATTQLVFEEGTNLLAIENVPGGQGPLTLQLEDAARYSGQIKASDGRPMPNVTVTASALAYKGELAEVARYNRTVTAITDRHGKFELAVDTGYFDLLVEPPADSGFAWSGSLNRILDDPAGSDTVNLTMQAPVYVTGHVESDPTNPKQEPLLLPGTRIEAYALVSSLAGGRRAVRIGQSTSDELGNFRLALPATIGEELCDPQVVAYCDCGPGIENVRRVCESPPGTYSTCDCPIPTPTGN